MESSNRRRTTDRVWTLDRIVITVTAILSIVGLVFSLGVNYQRLSSMDKRLDEFIANAQATYVRRDVSATQWDSVDYQLSQVRSQLEELRMVIMAHPAVKTTPVTPTTPRFR